MSIINKHILILVENLPVPFDRRVWQEATTLKQHGYDISIICPIMKGYTKRFEVLEGIDIYRYPLNIEAGHAFGYLLEYSIALVWTFIYSWNIYLKKRFHAIHACNPPDLFFLIGLVFKPLSVKFVFDHHDINPELYIAKYGKKDFFYKIVCIWERCTFLTANASIATNESYKKIAIDRGKMYPDRVVVVRSGPDISRLKIVPPNPVLKQGKKFLIGYLGVIGPQEGLDHLLEILSVMRTTYGRNDFKCLICGGGSELTKVKRLSDEMNLNDIVQFLGRIPDETVFEVLSTADVCVNTDIPNELNNLSTMNKIMEYMALRKPIVQYDLLEGRVSAGNASLYACPNDRDDFAKKIITLLDDPTLAAHMGDCGYQRIQEVLQWKYESPKLLSLYGRLFNE
jgi:glycosyltransferase involved in cell wall biosynthesis